MRCGKFEFKTNRAKCEKQKKRDETYASGIS